MSTISTATSQVFAQRPPQPPQGSMKDRMSATIGSAVSAGSLSGTDATALTSALTAIDASLSADRTGATAEGSRAKRDPSAMTDKIDGLISDQVSAGTLTDDQASELKTLFASGGRSMSAGATGGPGGAPPPGPPPDGPDADASSDDGTNSVSATGSAVSDLLGSFIKQLQSLQSNGSAYGASGASRTASTSSALVLDISA